MRIDANIDMHWLYECLSRPPLSFYSRKPVVVLPKLRKRRKTAEDPEKAGISKDEHAGEDALDQHVEDVLRKRDKFRRVMQGVWSFVKTREFESSFSASWMLTHVL